MADQNSAAFRATWQALGIQYSDYIRTTEERHKRVVQAILQTLWDAGEIYLGKYGGHYCYGCERFYTEKEIVDGKCPDHQTPLTWIEEENYFFKMSKYQSWLIEHLELKEKYGNDAFRYFVLREMVFGLDADFSEEAFVGRLNADLANDLGNLVSRATTLIVNLGQGVVPARGNTTAAEDGVAAAFAKAKADVAAAMEEFAFQRALASMWEFVGVVNRYVDATQPWALAKDAGKRDQLAATLATLAESLKMLGIVLAPFLPDAAAKIRAALGQTAEPTLADAAWGRLAAGTPVQKLSGLFPRVDDKKSPATTASAATEATPRIKIDEFGKIELRVAEIVAAEPLPKSKKLLKLTVSLGQEQRTVVAGIAEHYTPAEIVGKKVVSVANLEAAKLMGVESNGMVLAASSGGKLAVLSLDRDLPPGAKVT